MGATSIPCDEATRDRLKAMKGDHSWDELLIEMADQYDDSTTDDALARRMDSLEQRLSEIESMATRR